MMDAKLLERVARLRGWTSEAEFWYPPNWPTATLLAWCEMMEAKK